MVRAHSLLYAIYVCLIVSILCGALIYYANLYNILNQYYNAHEDLYIQNQSMLNFALDQSEEAGSLANPETGIASEFEIKSFGLLKIAIVKSSFKNDTVASAHFIGHYPENETALYLVNFSNPLSYHGDVIIIGDKKLPSRFIEEKYISNSESNIISKGKIDLSENSIPEINPDFRAAVTMTNNKLISLKDIERTNDSVYYNSFLNEAIEIDLASTTLQNVVIKGNFILYAKDSLEIKKDVVLEDVILKSPIIKIENDFKGTIQAFASKKIDIGANVTLSYPSVISIYNSSDDESQIKVNENSSIYGAVVLFGTKLMNIDDNKVVFKEHTKVVGDIYCTGKLKCSGKVFGTVVASRIFSQNQNSIYENCIINVEIDVTKRPNYFVSIPLFKNLKKTYGVFKKVL